MSRIHKPSAQVRIRAGQEGKSGSEPTSWSYGMVEVRKDGKWVPHPAWDNTPGMEPTEFDVVLHSNTPGSILQAHLDCRHTARSFCFRPHDPGDESMAVALRMDRKGNYVHVECDPRKCPMRILAKAAYAGGKEAAASRDTDVREYSKAFPWANLVVGKRAVKCQNYTFFTFTLLTPDGKPAHNEGEFAMFATHSITTTDRLREKLRLLYARTDRRLKGLRLRFVYDPFKQSDSGKQTSAWNLVVPEGTDFDRLMLEASSRTRYIDYDKIDADSTALVLDNTEYNIRNWIAHEHPEALAEVEAGLDFTEQSIVDARAINPDEVYLVNQHPTVRALCVRCRIPYAQQVAMPMHFGEDVLKCVESLVEAAKSKDRFIDDIIQESPFAGAFAPKRVHIPEPEIVEAEIVQPEPGRTPDEMVAATKGKTGNQAKGGDLLQANPPAADPVDRSEPPEDTLFEIADDDIDKAVQKLGKGKK